MLTFNNDKRYPRWIRWVASRHWIISKFIKQSILSVTFHFIESQYHILNGSLFMLWKHISEFFPRFFLNSFSWLKRFEHDPKKSCLPSRDKLPIFLFYHFTWKMNTSSNIIGMDDERSDADFFKIKLFMKMHP